MIEKKTVKERKREIFTQSAKCNTYAPNTPSSGTEENILEKYSQRCNFSPSNVSNNNILDRHSN